MPNVLEYDLVVGFVESVVGPTEDLAENIRYMVTWKIGSSIATAQSRPSVPRWPAPVIVRALAPGTPVFGVRSAAGNAGSVSWVAPIEMPAFTGCTP